MGAGDGQPPSGWRVNEPNGFVQVSSAPFNATTEWGLTEFPQYSGDMSIISDATAPRSPNNVGAGLFAAQTIGAGDSLTPFSYEKGSWSGTDVYICMAFKVSSNWQGHTSGNSKVLYLTGSGSGGGGDPMFCAVSAIGLATPLTWRWAVQNPEFGSWWYTWDDVNNEVSPTVGDATIVRGQWHIIETRIKCNTPGSANGEVHCWIDQTKIFQFTGQEFMSSDDPTGALDNLRWEPIWGGTGGTVNENMYQYFDEIYLSKAA